MALSYLAPFPKRTTQGTDLTSYQHDEIHEGLRLAYNALVDIINTGGGGATNLPIGASIEWWAAALPSGFLWLNGAVYDKTVYPALFSVIGTTYNVGGEGPNDFRMPNKIGRVGSGINPMGGITDGAQPSRVLGAKFGAITTTHTPAGSVSVNVTNGAMGGSLDVTNGAMSGALNVTNAPLSGGIGLGTLASNVSVNNNALTGDILISNGAVTGEGTAPITGKDCLPLPTGEPSGQTVIDCDSNLTVSISTIASALTTNVTGNKGDLASNVVAVNGAMTGSLDISTLNTNVSVALGTLASNVSVDLGTLASNVSASGSFTGTQASISTLQPSIASAWIIRAL